MKTYIISFVTVEGLVMLNYAIQALSLKDALEDIEHPTIVLSIVVLIPVVNQQEDEDITTRSDY